MDKKFDSDYIKELVEEMSKSSSISYDDLPKYDLFLSQVIDYLNDKFVNEKFTNNIVQNYTKSEVITKPEDGKKRGYTKMHLVQLVLLSYMRPILTTEEIKKVFRLAFNEINDRSDDILSWEEAYKVFVSIQKDSMNDYLISSLTNEEKLETMVKEFNLKDKDEEKDEKADEEIVNFFKEKIGDRVQKRIRIFLLVLTLIAEASVIKKLVQKIVSEYHED